MPSLSAPCTELQTLLDKPNTNTNQLQHNSSRCSISNAIHYNPAWLASHPGLWCYNISDRAQDNPAPTAASERHSLGLWYDWIEADLSAARAALIS